MNNENIQHYKSKTLITLLDKYSDPFFSLLLKHRWQWLQLSVWFEQFVPFFLADPVQSDWMERVCHLPSSDLSTDVLLGSGIWLEPLRTRRLWVVVVLNGEPSSQSELACTLEQVFYGFLSTAEKHLYSVMLPSPCFTLEMTLQASRWAVPGFHQTQPLIRPQSTFHLAILPKSVFGRFSHPTDFWSSITVATGFMFTTLTKALLAQLLCYTAWSLRWPQASFSQRWSVICSWEHLKL